MGADRRKNPSILGHYTGKSCDTNVFNNNDMHLGTELFNKVISSEEYQRALKNKHYIGFLGHPENPDCQDFEHACIVMTDMRLLDNGEVEADFDLIDTPVGRIVKAFTDAGVNFGISIRGLGDVETDGEVVPDEFIFRGYDLVTFPAYDDCIPKFVAASTDRRKQANYKKICASIHNNLPSISSSETLEFIKDQLPEDSESYMEVQNRIDELSCPEAEDEKDIQESKLAAVTDLYLDAAAKIRELEQTIADLSCSNKELEVACKTNASKFTKLKKIVSNQLEVAKKSCEDASDYNEELSETIAATRSQLRQVKASLHTAKKELKQSKDAYRELEDQNSELISANTNLTDKLERITASKHADRDAIEAANNLNLKYQQKIKANSEAISEKDSTIEELQSQLNETVVACKKLESRASNLGANNKELLSRVEAAEEMVFSYQQAYANMYANALGVYLTDLPITATTSVEDLKKMITAGTSTANIPAAAELGVDFEEDYRDEYGDDTFDDEVQYSAGLVTI